MTMGIPKVVTGLFEGILLFFLLTGETLQKYKMPLRGAIQRRRRRVYVLFVLDDDMHVEDVTVGVMDSHEPISEDQVNEISSEAREEVFEHVQVGEPRVVSAVPVLLLLAVAVVRGRPPVSAVVHLPVRVGALPQLLLVLLHRVHSLQARAPAPLGLPCGGVSVIHGPPTPAAGCVGSQRCGRLPRGRPPRHLPRPRARARPRRSNAPG